MTTDAHPNIAPFLIRQATVLDSSKLLEADTVDANGDPMPAVVERFTDGSVAHRKTYTTEVRAETTDDN